VGHPLWREDGSVIYSNNCFWALPEQWLLGRSPAELTTISYCLIWDSTAWRARSPYLYSPGTGWPNYTPGHWVPFCHLLRLAGLRWRFFNPPPHRARGWREVKVKLKILLRPTVSRPQPVLVSGTHLGPATNFPPSLFIYFYTVACLLMWGALSDEKTVCNLRCNNASSIYIATDDLSASSSWCRVSNGAHDQILIFFVWQLLSSRCRAPSPISPMNRVIQPKVNVKSQSHVSVGRNF
jgi:hypothetical protein